LAKSLPITGDLS